jgi:nitroreductase
VLLILDGGKLEVFEAVKARRSIRKYRDESIPQAKVERLLETARLAPSGSNLQNWKFIVVEDKNIRKRLVEACNNQSFVGEASLVIAGVVDPSKKWHQVDLAIAFEHMVLEALDLGLGTCWIGAFQEDRVKDILRVPKDKKVVALLTVGVPSEAPPPRPRKPLGEIVCYNEYA